MYINTHTYFSLRYGTIKPKDLLKMAQGMGIDCMALTDINNSSACLDFVRLAPRYGLKPVIGVDFRQGARQQFILLAKNNHGFLQINNYLSGFLHQQQLKIPEQPVPLADTLVVYPFATYKGKGLKENEFLGVRASDLNRLKFSHWKEQPEKLLALHTVSFKDKKGFNTHRLLRAIDKNTLLSKLPVTDQGHPEDLICPPDDLIKAYEEFPWLLENTQKLLHSCSIDFDFSQEVPNNQRSYTGNTGLDYRLLRKLSYAGLSYRYKRPGGRVMKRIEKELDIIHEKGFVSYFLINWKILKYARSKGYFYVGRGSGANSIIAYLLRITDVDPVELDLYFERFINLYRKNPPDFDIDFSWSDRDDITEFIFRRFPHTALLTVYNTFKYKASVRELGKVFGLPKSEIDRLSGGDIRPDKLDKLSRLVLIYSESIQGFPNYLGIHAGGILISEKPIHYYTATFLPPKVFRLPNSIWWLQKTSDCTSLTFSVSGVWERSRTP
ncbi:PHP domain-containing protein [Aureitalea marina]|uniref:PHP domain-containing protein n=1 Tax=Aureitalea marina TaxID=930804 RepID=UPI0026D59AB5